jgi:uncharacterized protein YjbI with pentapeptide repeats
MASPATVEPGGDQAKKRAGRALIALMGDLAGADLAHIDLSGEDLSGRDLSGATLSGATLRGTRLVGCNISGADLSDADLTDACLSRADLDSAKLRRCTLVDARLDDADLDEADLSGADLRGADLTDASIRAMTLNGATWIPAQLRAAKFDQSEGFHCPVCGRWFEADDLGLLGESVGCAHITWQAMSPFWGDEGIFVNIGAESADVLHALLDKYPDDVDPTIDAGPLEGLDAACKDLLESSYQQHFAVISYWVDSLAGGFDSVFPFAADPEAAESAAWQPVRDKLARLENPFRAGSEGCRLFEQQRSRYPEVL